MTPKLVPRIQDKFSNYSSTFMLVQMSTKISIKFRMIYLNHSYIVKANDDILLQNNCIQLHQKIIWHMTQIYKKKVLPNHAS